MHLRWALEAAGEPGVAREPTDEAVRGVRRHGRTAMDVLRVLRPHPVRFEAGEFGLAGFVRSDLPRHMHALRCGLAAIDGGRTVARCSPRIVH